MMDTVLNISLNDITGKSLARDFGAARFFAMTATPLHHYSIPT